MIGGNLYNTQGWSHPNARRPSFRSIAGPPGKDQWVRAPYIYYQSMMVNSRAPMGYHHLSHKTALCKHFTTKGHCPMGEMCNFVHDLSLCGIPDERTRSTTKPPGSVPGMAYFPNQTTHCWAFVHGRCKFADCQYVHPADTAPFLKHTPCLAWPACFYGDGCRFKHPEPLPVPLPIVQTVFHSEARNVRSLQHRKDMQLSHRVSQGRAVYYHQPFQQGSAQVSPAPHLPVKSPSNVAAPMETFSSFELPYERALNAPSAVSTKENTMPPSLGIVTAVQSEKGAAQEFSPKPTSTSTLMAPKGHARRISVPVKSELEIFAKASPRTPAAHVKRQSWAAFSAADRHSNRLPC